MGEALYGGVIYCAPCLIKKTFERTLMAITIVNGQAVCGQHLEMAAALQTPGGGPVAMSQL